MLRILKTGLAIVALILPVVVAAQPPGGGPGPGPGMGPGGGHQGGLSGPPPFHGSFDAPGFGADIWNRPEIQKRLGLSEEQVERLQQSSLELETKRIDTQAKTEIARLNLESLLKKKEIDKAAVEALVNELGELHKANIRGMVQQKIALGEILQATQLEKVEAFLDRARERQDRRPFMENFWGGGDPNSPMREEMQKRRSERMEMWNPKGEKGPKKGNDKKDRKGDPGKGGFGPHGQGPLGPPPGAGFGGPGRPGFGGPYGPGFGPPPPPPFPPSEFGAPPVSEFPPPEDLSSDLGESLEEAAEPAQE